MSHTYSCILLHYVWTTKDRKPLITKELKPSLVKHIIKYGTENKINIIEINAVRDHVHLLINQKTVQSTSQVANLINGESSHWINSNDFIRLKFAWQEGFSVFSVSPSHVVRLRKYIVNQEEHHKKITYEEEVKKFLDAYGIENKNRD
jgi:REP-associated tyrosine transposase